MNRKSESPRSDLMFKGGGGVTGCIVSNGELGGSMVSTTPLHVKRVSLDGGGNLGELTLNVVLGRAKPWGGQKS